VYLLGGNKMNWAKIFVFTAYTAFILAAFSTCSCTQKAWTKRGVKNGWIDTSKKANVKFDLKISLDTNKTKELSNDLVNDIKTIINDTCVNKEQEVKIKKIFQDKYIPKIIKESFPDTILYKDGVEFKIHNTGKGFEIDINHPKQEIKEAPCDPWYSDWPYWLIIAILLLLVWILKKR
jgi:hypothetical protein